MMRSSMIQKFWFVRVTHAIGKVYPYLGSSNEGSDTAGKNLQTVVQVAVQIFKDRRTLREHIRSTACIQSTL